MNPTLESYRKSHDIKFESQDVQRWAMLAGGTALVLLGIARRSKTGAALAAAGGALAVRNIKSHTPKQESASASFAINCSPEQAYQFWHNYENLPRFMHHLKSVKVTGDGRSEWTAEGPFGTPVTWTAETVADRENQLISWRSAPGSAVNTEGAVHFHAAPNGRGTVVSVRMNYQPPGGAIGQTVATLTGRGPQFTVREDLRRFKAILEAGEAPTTRGQSHGPRGIHGHASQIMLSEKTNRAEPQQQQPELRRTA